MSRQRDELSPEAREIIDAAKGADGPTTADRDRLRGAVFAAIAGGGATTAASTAEAVTTPAVAAETIAQAGGLSTLAKVTIVAALVGGATGLYLAATSQSDEPTTPAPTVAPPAPEPVPEPDLVEPDRVDPAPAPEPEPEPDEQPVARKKARTPPPLTATTKNNLEQESALLELANEALRSGRPRRAIELVAESEQLFPDARLGPERSATRVLALCALGRNSESDREQASAALRRFRQAHPRSPFLERLESACQATP